MDDLYDAILTDALDDIYNVYLETDGIIDQGEDMDDYWDIWYDFDETYWDAWYQISDDYWNSWYQMCDSYWEIWSGFCADNFDVDAILAAAAEDEEDQTEPSSEEEQQTETETETQQQTETETETGKTTTDNADTSTASNSGTSSSTELVDGMRPEFKAAMDSYEEFFDEYCAFMQKYAASGGNDLSMLSDYVDFMSKYSETMEQLEAWEDEDLNSAELSYYLEVTGRITQELTDTATALG